MDINHQSVLPKGNPPEKMPSGIKEFYILDECREENGKRITEEALGKLLEDIRNKEGVGISLYKDPDLDGDYMQIEADGNLIFLQYVENYCTSDECIYSCFNPDYLDSDEWSPIDVSDGQSVILMRYTMEDAGLAAKCVEYFVRTGQLYPGMAWLKE